MAGSGGIGANPRNRRRKGVGVGQARPSPKPKSSSANGGLALPPFLTFDPGISAKIRASERGLEDIETDVGAKRHFANRDLAEALRGIRTSTARSRGSLNRSFTRGQRKLGEQETDVRQKATRANQDFDTQLADIGRRFAQLGQRQREAANAAGVIGGGTSAAAAAARAQNQRLAERPIHTARQRVEDDLATALRRIGTAREDLGEDLSREIRQLHQDRDRERKLVRRQTGRARFSLKHELERARREKEFSAADLAQQAIYEARNNRPGAFTKRGRRKSNRRRR